MASVVQAGSIAIEMRDMPKTVPVKEKAQDEGRDFGLGTDNWHTMSEEELFLKLTTSHNGLNVKDHEAALLKWGPNLITPPKIVPFWIRYCLALVGGFQMMLWFGSVLCFVVFGINPTDIQTLSLAIILILVVVVTTTFQMFQEGKSDKVMEALKALAPSTTFVIRDGEVKSVMADTLVPGDIVKITGGEKVPADLRILSGSDLKVNNASLTGENVDIKIGKEANHKDLYEAKNVARSGCNFTSGTGVGVVFSTGDHTFFGTIAASTTQIKRPETLMKHEVHRLIKIMAIVAFSLGIAFFILALLNGYNWIEAIVFMIGIVVANVPEGLLPQMTVALTLTAQRMLAKKVLVSNLEIIETLGAVDVICSDKTGTLTCNRMSVSHVVYNKTITVTPITPAMEGDTFLPFVAEDAGFKALRRIATLNSDAFFLQSSDSEPDVLKKETKGDASESAIIKFCHPLRNIIEMRTANKRQVSIPFNSSNKWMLSLNEKEEEPGKYIVLIKGAPERVMNMCTAVLNNGVEEPMTEETRAHMEKINETLAKRGERVLAFAHLELDPKKFPAGYKFDADCDESEYGKGCPNFPVVNLTLVGLLSLIDPPRMSVKPSIGLCNTAGIKVFMVTGDHPITAHAIAKSLGIITKPTAKELEEEGKPVPADFCDAIVVHGTEMLQFSVADWSHVLKHKEIVFARTMPQQKQDIVNELNKLKNVVAMTGDGVNDAPALKAANVGIAMGSGSAVAKEAAQLILLDDDFGAIVDGIREGRLIFENLKKCIAYVLSSNVPELVPFLLFISMKIPLAIETICILLIDLGTDLAPAVSIAYEEPEDAIMNMPPRNEHAHLVGPQMMVVAYGTIGMFQSFAAFYSFMYVYIDMGFSLKMIMGSGLAYRDDWKDKNHERKSFFANMCRQNTLWYVDMNNGDESKVSTAELLEEPICQQKFVDYCVETLAYAQGAFLVTVVWSQMANALIRKTQVATIFSWSRLFDNKVMMWSMVFEVGIILLCVYPGSVVFLMLPDSEYFCTALWVIPWLIVWDEIRKWGCRQDTVWGRWLKKYSNF